MRLLIFILALLPLCSRGQTLDAAQIKTVEYQQKLGAVLPLGVAFHDERGATVRLGHYFGQKPIVLVFAYFSCPNLCGVVLNGTMESLRQLPWTVGAEYEVIVVSIDPRDTPAVAQARKTTYALRYGRPGSSAGWHFLTGDAEAIRTLTDATGFHFSYDAVAGQYAHASGILVATPGGRVSRYFLGIEYPAKAVRVALAEAGRQQIGGLAERLLLLCFHYNPQHGRYGTLIARAVQVAGLGTVAALGYLMVRLQRRARLA